MGLWEAIMSAGCSCDSRARVEADRKTASLTTKIPVYEAQTTRASGGEGEEGEREAWNTEGQVSRLEKRTLTHHILSVQNTQDSVGWTAGEFMMQTQGKSALVNV